MDIKWKNSVISAIGIILFLFGLGATISSIGSMHNLVKANYLQKSTYVKSEDFQKEIDRFTNDLYLLELTSKNKNTVNANTITEEEIESYRYAEGNLTEQIQNVHDKYEEKIEDAKQAKSKKVEDAYVKQRDLEVKNIQKKFQDDQFVREEIAKNKEFEITRIYDEAFDRQKPLSQYKKDIMYYLKDRNTQKIYTNIQNASKKNVNQLVKQKNMLYKHTYSAQSPLVFQLDEYKNSLLSSETDSEIPNRYLKQKFTGIIAVPEKEAFSSSLFDEYNYFHHQNVVFLVYVLSGIIALLIVYFIYKKTITGHLKEITRQTAVQRIYKKVPLDMCIIVFLLYSFFTSSLVLNGYPTSLLESYKHVATFFFYMIAISIAICLWVLQVFLLFQRMRTLDDIKEEYNRTCVYQVIYFLQSIFIIRHIGMYIMVVVLLLVFAVFAVAALLTSGSMFVEQVSILYLAVGSVIGVVTLILLMLRINYLNKIIISINQIATAEWKEPLPIKGKSALTQAAIDINHIQQQIQTSQHVQVKSERLKTELITNVSHDLRTPLTSIMTYTALLKSQDLTWDEQHAYVEIIDRKSKRLQTLIDDLFEVSKMASGNVELHKDTIDINQLLHQALAEYDEAIKDSTLQFRIQPIQKPIFATVDGQKLWRVFDNLIENILKYSLEQTRVYISVQEINEQVKLTFKNVSKYELNEQADELFERFKRGDASRQTDGSGLGLAIAKSIIDLHGGELNIEIDGDLFKVTITL
ncbi:histidine kinase dimerization/phospho-acceptor domain-containing protein [Priestia aryabhattai]|uniref:sensor histidine kinase n=1 Tax=Priestia aryabhattai TaxID=412384 RepID=UPI0003A8B126|nr:histidine kinase dimerization/phospho-acceptor domain-containing protein [Priestia aryabhattai]MED3920147.1 histidine kinase dimerization/phospho-acceptor domain-containing protein [Priestia aryabhattai]MED3958178.1 histidine kinase dimerization/phospho-acceptor domain-containing protein [Priestia aryabhattai]MED3991754.1 histidine kinase dimerization/phospho-acceptor domain-containing protein [Priestia aryabhattai]MED4007790.1 histidine kinase dimerization/phospho-acceptor domain-containing